MAKYYYDFKWKIVKAYLNWDGEYKSIANSMGFLILLKFRNGLKRKNKHSSYTVQFKLDVRNYMATSK